jgi:hypothetical protein
LNKKNTRLLISSAVAVAAVFLSTTPVSATVISQNVTLSSQNQSMWGTGSALQYQQNIFVGTTWNKSGSAGGFIGGNTQILNPGWVAWNACPFHLCGSEPPKFLNIDTKSGLQVSASTTGKVGFNLGVNFDSGSVNALTNYNTQIDVPTSVSAGQLVTFNTRGSSLTGGSLSSQFPTASATLSAVLQVSANFAATGCLTGTCGTASLSTGTLGGTQPIVALNPDGQGGIQYFGGTGFLSDALNAAAALGEVKLPTGFPASLTIPPTAGTGSLGSITAFLPQPNASGGLNAAGTGLTATGSSPLLGVSLDVGNLLSEATTGTTGYFDGSVDMGHGFGVDYNLVNVQMGPQINLTQTFDLTPTLLADLQFSQPVDVSGYGMVTSVNGVDWNNLPSMVFGSGITTITPTFYLGATVGGNFTQDAAALLDQLMLQLQGNLSVNVLNATFNTPFGSLPLGLGTVFDNSFNLLTSPPIFSNEFAMAGFSPEIGQSFNVDALTSVPEPGALSLAGAGLLTLGLMRLLADRRRRRTGGSA